MHKIFFTPGPAALYFTVEQHIKNALKENIPSISHRGKDYGKMHEETTSALRTLLSIPDNFNIGFTSSATEVWERSIENLVDSNSTHFVNGSFSKKFYSVAKDLKKNATAITAKLGSNNDITTAHLADGTELITLAQNETSTGAAIPVDDIKILRSNYPEALIALDVVSSTPIVDIDLTQVDSMYFSVQKCFGLPAGLGVWVYNERCLKKAKSLKESGKYHNAYNSILNIDKFAQKHQTCCTPNVLNIYLLGQVVKDMLHKGLDQIRREAFYKSALIYDLYDNHNALSAFVQEKKYRSITVGVAEVKNGATQVLSQLAEKGLIVGGGYGSFKGQHIRIANFPTHSKEQMEMLVDTIRTLDF